MNRLRLAALGATLLLACQQTPVPPAGLSETDKAAIMAQRAAFVQALNAGDAAKAVEIFAPDAVVLMGNAPAIHGMAAITAFYAGLPPLGDFKVYGEEFESGGDLVVIRGAESATHMPPGATVAITDTGKYVEVWKKQADGTWKLLWDIGNSDRAPAPPPAAK
jgi:ketosteroid isomerase-like protein